MIQDEMTTSIFHLPVVLLTYSGGKKKIKKNPHASFKVEWS